MIVAGSWVRRPLIRGPTEVMIVRFAAYHHNGRRWSSPSGASGVHLAELGGSLRRPGVLVSVPPGVGAIAPGSHSVTCFALSPCCT